MTNPHLNSALKKLVAAAIIACVVLPGSAAAAVVWDLTGAPGSFVSGTLFTDPLGQGWNVTITSNDGSDIHQNGDGLGTKGGSLFGLEPQESLTFTFSSPAGLEGFSINLGSNDQVTHGVNGSPSIVTNIPPNSSPYFIPASGTANSLTILNSSSDLPGAAYRVSSISFVPIPAAAWLFGSGLLGLVGIARRKKSA